MTRRRPVSIGLLFVCLAIGLFVVARRPAQMPGRLALIVDTDAGADDLIALAYLLGRPDVDVEAITSVNGVAHADAGARNVLRLLRLTNRRIPVYVGADQPLEGRDAFPPAWRQQADDMPALPRAMGRRPRPDAVSALLALVRDNPSATTVLALGPLTNIAQAVNTDARAMKNIAQLIVMGGAIDVPGNAPDGSAAPVAEWNMFVDPTAASIVLRAGINLVLVPLDATNRVPIDRSFVQRFAARGQSPLGRVVVRLLSTADEMIDARSYYAWDPLAAVFATDPAAVKTRPLNVSVVRTGDERGRTVVNEEGEPNAMVGYDAAPAIFRRNLFDALTR